MMFQSFPVRFVLLLIVVFTLLRNHNVIVCAVLSHFKSASTLFITLCTSVYCVHDYIYYSDLASRASYMSCTRTVQHDRID